MNNMFYLHSNNTYAEVVNTLIGTPDRHSSNRKGESLCECLNVSLEITHPYQAYFWQRDPSLEYLEKELEFYLSGSRNLDDAVKCSKFWSKCSDDGRTINSNYGALLFHDVNSSGNTQFEYALSALTSNPSSKKAVMVLHDAEHSYVSKDNPCTMFVHFFMTEVVDTVTNDDVLKLHMRVVMRSNDIWFGVTYDMPFFAIVWEVMRQRLQGFYGKQVVELGTYTHQALNLHMYDRSISSWKGCEASHVKANTDAVARYCNILDKYTDKFYELSHTLSNTYVGYMQQAAAAAQKSPCLKKKCGCVVVHNKYGVVGEGYGGRAHGDTCITCARDAGEVFHGDGCWSVHAEMRAAIDAVAYAKDRAGCAESLEEFFNACVVYVTHGPCDACLKLLDFLNVRTVCYDKPYKTNYDHWPRIHVLRVQLPE